MGHIILMATSYKQVLSHYNIIIMATIIGVKYFMDYCNAMVIQCNPIFLIIVFSNFSYAI
jgi:hypothetical protein